MKDLSDDTITDLLSQIAKGSDKAATQLYKHYYGFLFAYLRHRLGDVQAAEDVTQEVFVSVFRKPTSYAGVAKFSTWLCAVGKFKGVDWWRKNGREQLHISDDEAMVAEQEDPNADFVSQLQTAQDHDALRHCVDRLPADQRETIFWVYFQEEGVDVVAGRLQCPPGTVKSRLFNARKKLQDCMSRWISGGRYGSE